MVEWALRLSAATKAVRQWWTRGGARSARVVRGWWTVQANSSTLKQIKLLLLL